MYNCGNNVIRHLWEGFIPELPSHTQGRKYHFLCVTDHCALKENITSSMQSMADVKNTNNKKLYMNVIKGLLHQSFFTVHFLYVYILIWTGMTQRECQTLTSAGLSQWRRVSLCPVERSHQTQWSQCSPGKTHQTS